MDSEVELEHQIRRKRSRCIEILDPFSIDFGCFGINSRFLGWLLGGSWGLWGLFGGVFGEFDTDFLVFSRANSVQACPEPRVFSRKVSCSLSRTSCFSLKMQCSFSRTSCFLIRIVLPELPICPKPRVSRAKCVSRAHPGFRGVEGWSWSTLGRPRFNFPPPTFPNRPAGQLGRGPFVVSLSRISMHLILPGRCIL